MRISGASAKPRDLPPAWHTSLAGYLWRKTTVGLSGADVFRLSAPGRASLFAKVEPLEYGPGLDDEAARLVWLGAQGISCPKVVDLAVHAGQTWLLVTALPGRDMAATRDVPAPTRIVQIAEGLRLIHALPVAACPFDHRLDVRLAIAAARVAAETVDIEGEEASRIPGIFAALASRRPNVEDLVVTHGDATLPNMLLTEGLFGGFVDCGRVGVADRYQDLALTVDSITAYLGADYVAPFLGAYGIATPDRDRLTFYEELDAFF